MQRLHGSDLPNIDDVSCLLLQLETPIATVLDFARAARTKGIKVMLNAAPAQPLPAELLRSIDVLIVNEEELTTVAGRQGAIADVLGSVNVPCVIVTLGSRGCCAREQGKLLVQPAFKVDALDTTAAGDTFCGVLAAALCAQSLPLPEALRRASAAAALATTRAGAQSSIPMADEVEELLRARADGARGAAGELAAYCGVSA